MAGPSSPQLSAPLPQLRTGQRNPGLPVCGERARAGGPVVDDRLRIGFAENDAMRLQVAHRSFPRCMYPRRGQTGQFGNSTPYVVAVGVEPARLCDRVEYAEARSGVGPSSRHPLPIAHVLGNVGIEQMATERALTDPPIH